MPTVTSSLRIRALKRLLAVALLPALFAGVVRAQSEDESARVQREQKRLDAERAEAAAAAVARSTEVIYTIPDSPAISGNGLGQLGATGRGASLHLPTGSLHLAIGTDYNDWALRYYLDPKLTFAQYKAEQAQQCAAMLKSSTLAAPERKDLQQELALLNQATTPAQYDAMQLVNRFSDALAGQNALTPAQLQTIGNGCAKRYELAAELVRQLAAYEKTPHDAALAAKIYRICTDFEAAYPDVYAPNFLTPQQRKALGLDNPRQGHSQSVSSVSVGTGDADIDQMIAKSEAELRAKQKAAPLSFTLKCKAEHQREDRTSLSTRDGELLLFVEPLPDKSGVQCAVSLDDKRSWATTKKQFLESYQAPTEPVGKAFKEFLEHTDNEFDIRWGRTLQVLRVRTGEIPAGVQKQFDAMVLETTQAVDEALKLYRETLASPGDAALQKRLFDSIRSAARSTRRNAALMDRETYDPGMLYDKLPWLFTVEQLDLIHAGQLSTGSYGGGGFDGHNPTQLMLNARPAGDKQYASLTVLNQTLGDVVPFLAVRLRELYHNHKLKLTLDPAASTKPIQGLVEGTTPEELIKSLALRTGLTATKDEKDENSWRLK